MAIGATHTAPQQMTGEMSACSCAPMHQPVQTQKICRSDGNGRALTLSRRALTHSDADAAEYRYMP